MFLKNIEKSRKIEKIFKNTGTFDKYLYISLWRNMYFNGKIG